MAENVRRFYRRLQIEPYWVPIVALQLIVTLIYINHLRTGTTPPATAVTVLNVPVYWYGIFIVGGITLGAFVTSRLAHDRARRMFAQTIPTAIRERPLSSLPLPEEIHRALAKRKITTVGALLLQWGLEPRNLGLKEAGLAEVEKQLEADPDVEPEWLTDAPWRQWNPDHVWNGIIICMFLGLIGARLYHVLTPSPSMAEVGIYSPLDYFRNPGKLVDLRSGGLGIYGGLAGGALGLFIYTRRHRLSMLGWADLAAVGVALGQVFGRWGNFFNQELYGRPTNLPWAITIDEIHRLPDYADVSQFHPAFLYESLWSFIAFIVLLTLARRYTDRLLTGELTALYLILYAMGRTLLETVRLDSRQVAIGDWRLNMAVATLVSIIVAVSMAVWGGWRRWRIRNLENDD